MGQQITKQDVTACSELLPSEVATALASTSDELTLSSEQFDLIAIFAKAPTPIEPPIEAKRLKQVVGYLAAALRDQRYDLETGRVKLSAYARVLGDLPDSAVSYGADQALRESGWMPDPARLLELSLRYQCPIKHAHLKAQGLVFQREQRLWRSYLEKLKKRQIEEGKLKQHVRDDELVELQRKRLVIRLEDGSLRYWTAELEREQVKQRKAATKAILEAAALDFEHEKPIEENM